MRWRTLATTRLPTANVLRISGQTISCKSASRQTSITNDFRCGYGPCPRSGAVFKLRILNLVFKKKYMSKRKMSKRNMSKRNISKRNMSKRNMSKINMPKRNMSKRNMSKRNMSKRNMFESTK